MWLRCFACREPFELVGIGSTCGCRRSAAIQDGNVLEIRGPAGVLAPIENVVRMHGGEWAPMPEGITIRRRVAGAA